MNIQVSIPICGGTITCNATTFPGLAGQMYDCLTSLREMRIKGGLIFNMDHAEPGAHSVWDHIDTRL